MKDVEELVKSDIYSKFEELVKDLCVDDKAISFNNFLYAVALKNIHMTTEPTLEDIQRRFDKRDVVNIWKNRKFKKLT